jgi:hypothetical protein
MLAWMIAAVAVCGALSAFVLLLVGLRAVLQLRGTSRLERILPRARIHRRRRLAARVEW